MSGVRLPVHRFSKQGSVLGSSEPDTGAFMILHDNRYPTWGLPCQLEFWDFRLWVWDLLLRDGSWDPTKPFLRSLKILNKYVVANTASLLYFRLT